MKVYGKHFLPVIEVNKPLCVRNENNDMLLTSDNYNMFTRLWEEVQESRKVLDSAYKVINQGHKMLKTHTEVFPSNQ